MWTKPGFNILCCSKVENLTWDKEQILYSVWGDLLSFVLFFMKGNAIYIVTTELSLEKTE